MNLDDLDDLDLSSRLIITAEKKNNVVMIRLDGSITFLTQIDLQKSVRGYLNEGTDTIIFDMERTLFIDSTGLGYLIKLYRELKNINGKMIFARTAPQINELLKNSFGSRIEGLFYSGSEEIFNDKEE